MIRNYYKFPDLPSKDKDYYFDLCSKLKQDHKKVKLYSLVDSRRQKYQYLGESFISKVTSNLFFVKFKNINYSYSYNYLIDKSLILEVIDE